MAVPPLMQHLPVSAGFSTAYMSPVLQIVPDERQPVPYPACATCPRSLWFTTLAALRCYCTVMGVTTWDGEELPVMNCDGREAALAQLKEEENKK